MCRQKLVIHSEVQSVGESSSLRVLLNHTGRRAATAIDQRPIHGITNRNICSVVFLERWYRHGNMVQLKRVVERGEHFGKFNDWPAANGRTPDPWPLGVAHCLLSPQCSDTASIWPASYALPDLAAAGGLVVRQRHTLIHSSRVFLASPRVEMSPSPASCHLTLFSVHPHCTARRGRAVTLGHEIHSAWFLGGRINIVYTIYSMQ